MRAATVALLAGGCDVYGPSLLADSSAPDGPTKCVRVAVVHRWNAGVVSTDGAVKKLARR